MTENYVSLKSHPLPAHYLNSGLTKDIGKVMTRGGFGELVLYVIKSVTSPKCLRVNINKRSHPLDLLNYANSATVSVALEGRSGVLQSLPWWVRHKHFFYGKRFKRVHIPV
jgi:hypothetical protein